MYMNRCIVGGHTCTGSDVRWGEGAAVQCLWGESQSVCVCVCAGWLLSWQQMNITGVVGEAPGSVGGNNLLRELDLHFHFKSDHGRHFDYCQQTSNKQRSLD